MKGKLLIDGTVFSVEISDQDLQEFLASQNEKPTGYERVDRVSPYFYDDGNEVNSMLEENVAIDRSMYDVANYYSSRDVAINNARADRLMRKLRRFAVEHRHSDLEWNVCRDMYYIFYNYRTSSLGVSSKTGCRTQGAIYFDTEEAARAAIEEFRDELIWLFIEYKDSL